MATTPVLWQFRYSHYNEKARWALDYKGVRHVRRSLLPGPHIPSVLLRTGQKQVPVLELAGRRITDSTQIVAAVEAAFPSPSLYPGNPAARQRALDLEDYFDEELGPALRLAWFEVALNDPAYLARQLSVGFPRLSRTAYRLAFPVTSRIMRADMGINATNAVPARAKVMAALDRLEAELQPNGYLVGDSFSVADLTAAALWSPLVMPPEFPYPFLDGLPEPARTWRDSLVKRPGLRWVAEIYGKHRGKSAAEEA